MPFDIPNDPTAGVGAATYAAQAMPDEQDFKILAAAGQGTGVFNGSTVETLIGTLTWSSSSSGSNDVTTFAGSGTVTTNIDPRPNIKANGGTFYVVTSGGTAKITYTGTSATQITGCTTVTGTGTVTAGAAITHIQVATQIGIASVQNVVATVANAGSVASSFIDAAIVQPSDADATNPRIDLICCNSSGTVSVLAGTAAAVPCLPAITVDGSGFLTLAVLGAVYIPANATTLAAANIIDKRVLLRAQSDSVVTVADAALTMTAGQHTAVYTSLTVPRIVTLPGSAKCYDGYKVTVADASGNAAGESAATAKEIQIKPNGSDTVANVGAGTNWEEIREPYGSVTFSLQGTNWDIVSASPATRMEVFTVSSASTTFRKSLAAKTAHIILIGGGGAGGSGDKAASGAAMGGGGGGQAGGYSEAWLNVSDLSATETVTVGIAGTAGGTRTSTGAGASGVGGGDSKFTIAGAVALGAGGGVAGGGGNAGAAGTAGSGSVNAMYNGVNGGTGAKGSATAAVATAGTTATFPGAPGGGGGGGGVTTGLAAEAAAAGGNQTGGWGTAYTGQGGGAATGANGANITALGAAWFYGGTGGGGGTAVTVAGNGVAGGTGGKYGGGGGGGGNGMGATGVNSNGNGGVGGAGVVVIWTIR